MTRYSRSVIPGRPKEGEGGAEASLDRALFGPKTRPVAAANDRESAERPRAADRDVGAHDADRAEHRQADEGRNQRSRRPASDFPPLLSQSAPYRAGEDGRRGPILLVGALVIVAVFGVVVWSAYRDGVRGDDNERPAPELATAGAFKSQPREAAQIREEADLPPGPVSAAAAGPAAQGGPAPVGEIRASADNTSIAEHSAAAPASPVSASAVASAVPSPVPGQAAAPPPALKPSPSAPAPAGESRQTSAPRDKTAPAPATPPPATVTARAPASGPPISLPSPASPPPAAFRPSFNPGGSYVVQIAAPSTEASAITEWDKRVRSDPELFSGAQRFILKADVNGKSVYRLRAGPFSSKADADAFCIAFKARGGNCFPATR